MLYHTCLAKKSAISIKRNYLENTVITMRCTKNLSKATDLISGLTYE